MATSAYHVIPKEKENLIFGPNCIFKHTCMNKQTKLTKQGNYNFFAEILYSYLRYLDRLLDAFFFRSLQCYQSFMRNQGSKIELQKKYMHKAL